jgi:hypothetical protein
MSIAILLTFLAGGRFDAPAALAKEYVDAVAKVNDAQARKPEAKDEAELAKNLPASAAKALDELIRLATPSATGSASSAACAALTQCGEAALDLDRLDDFGRVRTALAGVDAASAKKLGIALSRPRFLVRGLDGMEPEGLESLADALDRVLDAYRDEFGFESWSKVPGKKLRVRAHLVAKITRPPHFAPEFPWHSEIDFPLIDAKAFHSPTPEGQFLLYGLCHELGHVIAMWGDRDHEEDHHAWAHYTGVAIVERLSKTMKDDPALKELKDVRWRSLEIERERLAKGGDDEKPKAGGGEKPASGSGDKPKGGTGDKPKTGDKGKSKDGASVKPALEDRNGVLALLIALHDAVGPKTIGEAINELDRESQELRINLVRYYSMKEFERALLATDAGKKHKKEITALFP